ncbi:MAG: hypothetical protein K6F35_10910 [Lachnospiraceae bacterium]|nr:hypothetical protein [Lachnospiraceae bacterium]
MRSIEEQMTEIRRRSTLYREKKQVRNLSIVAAGLGALLLAVLYFAPGVSGVVGKSGSVLGATILGPQAGGYVIVALLAFALGILSAIITQKYRKTNGIQKDISSGKQLSNKGSTLR